MRRRSEIISMGLSIAIAAVLLIQLLPSQSPLIRDLPKASKPELMVWPQPITLAAVPLPAPPPAPTRHTDRTVGTGSDPPQSAGGR